LQEHLRATSFLCSFYWYRSGHSRTVIYVSAFSDNSFCTHFLSTFDFSLLQNIDTASISSSQSFHFLGQHFRPADLFLSHAYFYSWRNNIYYFTITLIDISLAPEPFSAFTIKYYADVPSFQLPIASASLMYFFDDITADISPISEDDYISHCRLRRDYFTLFSKDFQPNDISHSMRASYFICHFRLHFTSDWYCAIVPACHARHYKIATLLYFIDARATLIFSPAAMLASRMIRPAAILDARLQMQPAETFISITPSIFSLHFSLRGHLFSFHFTASHTLLSIDISWLIYIYRFSLT